MKKLASALFAVIATLAPVHALDDIVIPNTFSANDTIRASYFVENNDSIRLPYNRLLDSLEAKFIRFTELENGDSTLDSLRVLKLVVTDTAKYAILSVSDTLFGDTAVFNVVTISDTATIGDMSADTANFVRIATTGTATFSGATIADLGTVTTANIDGGTIDGTTVGASSPSTGAFTTLSTTGTATFGDSINAGDASLDTVYMTRSVVSGTATFAGATIANLGTVTTANIDGGTIDGTAVGASSPSTGAFTTLNTSGNATLGNAGADAHTSNGTLTLAPGTQSYLLRNRSAALAMQAQSSATLSYIDMFTKDGDGTDFAGIQCWTLGTPDATTNYELLGMGIRGDVGAYLRTENAGSGDALPLIISTPGNTDQLKLNTDGSVSFTDSISAGDASLDTAYMTRSVVSGTATFSGATISDLGTVTTADINGGTIDGTTVGASSPSTGAFTTLSTTGTATFGDSISAGDASLDTAYMTRADVSGGLKVGTNGTTEYEVIHIFKPSDETVTSSAVFQNDDDFTFPIGANETYIFELNLTVEYGGGGIDFGITGPSSPTNVHIHFDIIGNNFDETDAGVFSAFTQTASYTTTNITSPAKITFFGTVENGANAGSVTLRWTQASSSVDATTVKRGSNMTITRVQ